MAASLTTVGLYSRIRSLMGDTPWYDTCAEAMDTTEVGLDVTDGTKYSAGVIVEFQDDGEQCLVLSVSSNTLTVIRNFNFSVGTTAGTGTSHSINAVIAANPAVKYVDITRALQGVVSTLWPYVWKVGDTNSTAIPPYEFITPVVGKKLYTLASSTTLVLNDFEIAHINQQSATAPVKVVTYGNRNGYTVHLQRGIGNVAMADAYAALYFPHINNYTYPINVGIIKPVTVTQGVAGTYNDFDDNTPAGDCLVYLTAARLVETLEITRTTQTDVSMGDATVQPGVRRNLALYLNDRGMQARNQWSMYCQRVWPKLPKSRFFKDERDASIRGL